MALSLASQALAAINAGKFIPDQGAVGYTFEDGSQIEKINGAWVIA